MDTVAIASRSKDAYIFAVHEDVSEDIIQPIDFLKLNAIIQHDKDL